MYADAKRRSGDTDVQRKEIHHLKMLNKKLEAELAAANRRSGFLQNDINLIHKELNQFSATFEEKLEESLRERDESIHALTEEVDYLRSQAAELNTERHKLAEKLEGATGLLKFLRSGLKGMNGGLADLTSLGSQELLLKQEALGEANYQLCSIDELHKRDLDRAVAKSVSPMVVEIENLKHRIEMLEKELVEARQEIAAEQTIEIREDIDIAKRSAPKLFTQGTLMLDFPKLFED